MARPALAAAAPQSAAAEVLWLGDPRAADPALAGGKAAALTRLAARHRVPPGFVLAFSGTAPHRSARAAVAAAYRRLAERCGVDEPPVAVRSSAVDEDSADASFAGQHDTVLGVAGAEQVWWAISRCAASFAGERAVAYRRRAGLPDAPQRAAVLVQWLVPADAGGVVFSANPLTGARDQVLVNAGWGLGESVVAGTVTPDLVVVDRATTGPPWTPLFAVVAVVVTDTGGVLSHSAVVAREYGIPAVVGGGDATSVIRDGDVVEVDGAAGSRSPRSRPRSA